MIGIGIVELGIILVLLGVMLGLVVWWLLMLIEALRIPGPAWEAAGHNQVLYVLGMFLLGILGTILYVLVPRKDLASRTAA